ncbi:MAG: hypothetical protein PHN44_10225 [Candidatus Marinimicrobia bacterium]|nr:hypothetical protein [Candidatus Neomarinimicrobiota bacterium]
MSKKKYPVQQVNLEGLERGLDIVYQGETFSLRGENWKLAFEDILVSMAVVRCRKQLAKLEKAKEDFVLEKYEKQLQGSGEEL